MGASCARCAGVTLPCSPPTCPFTPTNPPQAALELQLKYSASGQQLAALQPQLEEAQRGLTRWEARLGRQLEAIVGLQKGALSARSSASKGTSGATPLGENTPVQTPHTFRGL